MELNKKETAIIVSSSLIRSLHDLFEAAGVTKDDAGIIHRKLQSVSKRKLFSLFLNKKELDRPASMKLGAVKYDKRDGARGWICSINRKSVTLNIDGVKRRVPIKYITRFCQTGTGEGGQEVEDRMAGETRKTKERR